MANSYIPQREADLLNWSTNFDAAIAATPTAYGLTAEQATDYTTAQAAFAQAYQLSNNPATRTPSAIETKDDAKAALIAETRKLVNIVQAYPGTTDTMRVSLGITVRDYDPTPVPVPETAPLIEVKSVTGYTIALRLQNTESTKRAKPAGVIGAAVFSYVGDAAPTDLGDWKFEGNTSQTATTVTVPGTVAAGSKVWLTSFWFNRRSESGPATQPISTNIQGGGLSQAA
jgi:hypothetical protein